MQVFGMISIIFGLIVIAVYFIYVLISMLESVANEVI